MRHSKEEINRVGNIPFQWILKLGLRHSQRLPELALYRGYFSACAHEVRASFFA
jgi:hypothetical protein